MKITYSTSKINSFGGINFADSIIVTHEFWTLLTKCLVAGMLGRNIVTTSFSGRIC